MPTPGIVSFEILGFDKVRAGLAEILGACKDLRPFWRDVFAPKYFGMVQDLFATGGRSRGVGGRFSGGAWPRLSPKYEIWKRKNYPNRGILQREGDLQASVQWGGSGLGPGGIFNAQPAFVIAGTSIPYAARHNRGLAGMPMRQFMPPPDPAVFAPLMHAWILRNRKK